MGKIICKEFPKAIDQCITNPHVDVIKTRKDGQDTYFYEITATDVPTFVLDPKDTRPAGDYPDLEDTWCGGPWQGKKYNGCDYDLNLFDLHVCGDDDDGIGLGASIYSCDKIDDDYATTNTSDYVKATVKCWFQAENGERTEFACTDAKNYLKTYGEWDGTPMPVT